MCSDRVVDLVRVTTPPRGERDSPYAVRASRARARSASLRCRSSVFSGRDSFHVRCPYLLLLMWRPVAGDPLPGMREGLLFDLLIARGCMAAIIASSAARCIVVSFVVVCARSQNGISSGTGAALGFAAGFGAGALCCAGAPLPSALSRNCTSLALISVTYRVTPSFS